MSTTSKRILTIGVVLLLLLAGALLYIVLNRMPAQPATDVTEQTTTGSLQPSPGVLPPATPTISDEPATDAPPVVQTPPSPPDPRDAARRTAELFAERYASYSNQNEYQNLRDLLPLMTGPLYASTDRKLSESATAAAAYEGVTSTKLSSSVESWTESAGTAVVRVTLQQVKTSASNPEEIGYADLVLTLRKFEDTWKVSNTKWQPR